ncbi:MAG: pantoate--beta-alanine ligase [Amylibacter sp.]|jgi:pantoate--beta-alanine ligase|nr:pantoate--beta-alanine ligase [Amylibacter sp.]
MTPVIERDLGALRARVKAWKQAGDVVGVVPTMGALHAGHLSLAAAARAVCDRVIVTIFVNPKQFNNPEDLANYPRTEVEDAAKLAPIGVDVVYVPDGATVYPEGFSTTVTVEGVTECMDGVHRPGHFEGVATVVAKLFTQTAADKAFFGEKDFQQLLVVKRMAADLDIPIEVVGCPTIREANGLAMSSRNLRLSKGGFETAALLHTELQGIAAGLRDGEPFAVLRDRAIEALNAAGYGEVEYIDLRGVNNLSLLWAAERPARLFAAVWFEDVRLIDNIAV